MDCVAILVFELMAQFLKLSINFFFLHLNLMIIFHLNIKIYLNLWPKSEFKN